DVYTSEGRPKNRVRLRPEIAKNGRAGDVFLPDALVAKLGKFWRHKAARREELQPEDPLFCSQSRTRISPRRVQFAFRTWQLKAGFDRLYPFHSLRHCAITVLIADDLNTCLKIEKTFLTRAGFDVLTAENGARAVELARDRHPRLILLDLEMPEMDGAAACSAMRREPSLAFTPILIMSA